MPSQEDGVTKELAEIKFFRRKSDHYIYLKSVFLDTIFKDMSISQMGTEAPQIGDVHAISPEGSDDRVLYQFYKIRTLPETPYPLTANWDLLNSFGWLRAIGMKEGVEIPLPSPLTRAMANEITRRVQAIIRHLWNHDATENDGVVLNHVRINGERYA